MQFNTIKKKFRIKIKFLTLFFHRLWCYWYWNCRVCYRHCQYLWHQDSRQNLDSHSSLLVSRLHFNSYSLHRSFAKLGFEQLHSQRPFVLFGWLHRCAYEVARHHLRRIQAHSSDSVWPRDSIDARRLQKSLQRDLQSRGARASKRAVRVPSHGRTHARRDVWNVWNHQWSARSNGNLLLHLIVYQCSTTLLFLFIYLVLFVVLRLWPEHHIWSLSSSTS